MCDGDVGRDFIRIEPLHERWDLLEACAELLNAQWQRSTGARIHSLRQSSHDYPVCLLLLNGERRSRDEKLIGHARLSHVLGSRSLLVESVVVCRTLRGKGYGRVLMEGVERYARGRGCNRLCLTTHDKQHFYAHLGFVLSKPVQSVGTLASFMPVELLQKFCRTTENEEKEEKERERRIPKVSLENESLSICAPSESSHFPPPPPPPPLPPYTTSPSSCHCPPNSISCPPPPPPPTVSCPPPLPPNSASSPSWISVNESLEETPYTDGRGLPIFWMHKNV